MNNAVYMKKEKSTLASLIVIFNTKKEKIATNFYQHIVVNSHPRLSQILYKILS